MSFMEAAIGWLAPPLCMGCGDEGLSLCVDCAGMIKPFGERCWRCDRLSPASRTCPACRHVGPLGSVWISTTYEGLAQSLVRQFKFGQARSAAGSIAGIMSQTFRALGDQTADYLVIPVPTATARARERGFGHAELLAKTAASQLGFEYANALRRLGQSRQLGAAREVRLAQLADSFAAKNPRRLSGRRILLIDDVLTTGGTITAASKTLKLAGAARVDALLFAKRL